MAAWYGTDEGGRGIRDVCLMLLVRMSGNPAGAECSSATTASFNELVDLEGWGFLVGVALDDPAGEIGILSGVLLDPRRTVNSGSKARIIDSRCFAFAI